MSLSAQLSAQREAKRQRQASKPAVRGKRVRRSLPLRITETIAQSMGLMGTASAIDLAVRCSLQKLLEGCSRDREPMDSVGKFIALVRLCCIALDEMCQQKTTTNIWGLMIEAAGHWRAIEQRYITHGVCSLKAEERDFLTATVDIGMGLLGRCTEALISDEWARLENQTQVRALLGFHPETGLPTLDDGKLEAALGISI